ncbi:MAG TPA: hypothetical protein VGF96_01895 [Terracidiphilus sp.]|jgi:hypothetical protein
MNFTSVESVADAILFEGYILYPYRPSSLKNRQRWNFGTLYPQAFAEAQSPVERSQFHAEVLFEASPQTTVHARVRFLQLTAPCQDHNEGWEEGFPRCRTLDAVHLDELVRGVEADFDLSQFSDEERAAAPHCGERPCHGRLSLHATCLRDGVYKLAATFANLSPAEALPSFSRRTVQDAAFTSAHLMLGLEHGGFISLLEPPAKLEAAIKDCKQDGVFPVLAGEPEDRTRMLCSPIILYDYPSVAPESAGDFFDGTEMDEMLALRVLTLTDAEKEEMRCGDPHARAILERTETLPDEQLARVHGALRGLRRIIEHELARKTDEAIDLIDQPFDPFAEHKPVESVCVFGIDLKPGDRVRLWPQKKADILDMEMEGKLAVIEAIEQDLDNNVQFAVVLEDDPGRDLGMLRQTGHRFFFTPDEVEPVGMEIV